MSSGESGAGLDRRFVTAEELVVFLLKQGDLAAGANVHRGVEAGVLAAGAALGRRTQTFRGRHSRRTTGGLMRHLRLRDSGQMSANLHSTQRYSS